MFNKIVSFIFISFLFIFTVCYADGLGTYSIGYRMGFLNKFSEKGWVLKSGEGELLLGKDSTPYSYYVKDGRKKKKVHVNPFYFSCTNKKIIKQLHEKEGNYVVLKYKQSHIKNVNVDTDYEIIGVYDIGNRIDKVCIAKDYEKGHKSNGVRVGRFVKASSKGQMINSYEVMIQEGNSGNKFTNMSISKDDDMYQCVVDYLKAGQMVKVTYNESFITLNPLARETNYDIVKIEPIKLNQLN